MSARLTLDYYYGIEAEQFSFYRVPRLLIKDERYRGLSSDAKLLYGLMLDRMSLSMKNKWIDSQNRAYIVYKIEEAMEDLGCARATCVKIFKELDCENGIGLIEKVRLGLGKPDIIYVKNFATVAEQDPLNAQDSTEVQKLNFKKFKNDTSGNSNSELQEVQKIDFQKFNNDTSRNSENELQEVQNLDPNYTNNIHTENSQNDLSQTDFINPLQMPVPRLAESDLKEIDEETTYMNAIRENVDYEFVMTSGNAESREFFEEAIRIIQDALFPRKKMIRFGGAVYPYERVKKRLLELDYEHMQYVQTSLKNSTSKKYNIKGYVLSCLYSAPTTINQYYQQEVQHDLHGGALC
ncbi:MAG: replication initiator protein A [Acetatifactor sp.]|nr:replication initiator protein A [Acetatifactor sp.]